MKIILFCRMHTTNNHGFFKLFICLQNPEIAKVVIRVVISSDLVSANLNRQV